MDISYLNALRQAEMQQLLSELPPGSRILEFGSGTGEQARFLADSGFDVMAIDVPNSTYVSDRIFPVQDYDGRTIPLEDASVDVVFSSNVLEHVENLEEIFAEFRRVLRPNGLALHVLPTPAWRLWSFATGVAASLGAAAKLPKTFLRPAPDMNRWENLKRDLRRGLSGFIPRAHGTSREGISELWTFSRRVWRKRFERLGCEVVADWPMGLFYSGNLVLGRRLTIEKRRQLGRVLGSATHIYKVKVRSRAR